MKRTSLTTAVIAGIAGVAGISNMASAVYLNNDGLGSVLVYPYYTVNGGNSTAITVVNTTSLGKAVKVRFLEAYDSREVLDFNLYLSPFDLWTSQVVPVGAGAGVFSNDNSCTVPPLPKTAATAQAFSTAAFDGRVTANDGGPKTVSRTLEGYVELIDMGSVIDATGGENTLDAISHSGGVPASCAQVVKAWSGGGYWANGAGAQTDITTVYGGLFGSGSIINVGLGTIEGYNADAIDQFYADTLGHHTSPSSLSPSIGSATAKTSYVFAPAGTGLPSTLATTPYPIPIDAVSSLFMADSVFNEYWTSGGTAANSEWVVTFPTKRFYVDPVSITGITPPTSTAPFDVKFSSANGGTSCAPINLAFYDREEATSTTGVNFSPLPVTGNALCYETQVVTFNQGTVPSAVLGSNLVANIATGFDNGWATIDLAGASAAHKLISTASPNTFYGLPVTGFWVAQLVNGDLGGVLSNYTGLYRHKLHRTCLSGGAAGVSCS
jgi:hypothetical protein